jgi:hypothetical protein
VFFPTTEKPSVSLVQNKTTCALNITF